MTQPSPMLESVLTCPCCGFASVEIMPTNACVYFHECAFCHARLRPKHGDCCVYCSYGSVKCPPMQQADSCCDRNAPVASEPAQAVPAEILHDTTDGIFLEIKVDDLSGTEIRQLLREHLRSVALHSPPESVHALDIDALRRPGITFWTVWEDGRLLGCGALKELDSHHAEIKSMRTSSLHLRKGVAKKLLIHMLEEAKRRRYTRLSLETGSKEAFESARSLYAGFGFAYCEPFADYIEDPYSVFMTRQL